MIRHIGPLGLLMLILAGFGLILTGYAPAQAVGTSFLIAALLLPIAQTGQRHRH